METYKTRDLYLASFLITVGIEFINTEFDDYGKFFWFVFNNRNICELQENEFAFGDAIADTRKFSQSIKYLKKKVSTEINPNTNNHSNLNGYGISTTK